MKPLPLVFQLKTTNDNIKQTTHNQKVRPTIDLPSFSSAMAVVEDTFHWWRRRRDWVTQLETERTIDLLKSNVPDSKRWTPPDLKGGATDAVRSPVHTQSLKLSALI